MALTKKAERTKAKLLDSAQRLISAHGFDNVSVEDITKDSGVAKGTFYHYFECKEDVVRELSRKTAMATIERDASYGLLDRKKAQSISDDAIKLLNIRVPHSQVRAGGLSGGNQQKLLISRWVAIGPRILLLDEPTRGVDVGAKSEIYRIMTQMARQGVAILMISSELPEVVGMSDRVYVMREGSIAGELQAGDISQESIMTLATGVNDSHLKAVSP